MQPGLSWVGLKFLGEDRSVLDPFLRFSDLLVYFSRFGSDVNIDAAFSSYLEQT